MSRCVIYELDSTLAPIRELGRVRSVSIERNAGDDVPLLESCSVSFDTTEPAWAGGWYRIDYLADVREPLGIYRLERNSATVNGGLMTINASGKSLLQVAAEVAMEPGTSVPMGADGVAFAARMLADCGHVQVAGSAPMPRSLTFSAKDTRLSAAWAALDAIGWFVRLDGDGGIMLEPLAVQAVADVTGEDDDIVPGISVGGEISYQRGGSASIRPGDAIDVAMPRLGVEGRYRVLSQSVTVGARLSISETLGEWSR